MSALFSTPIHGDLLDNIFPPAQLAGEKVFVPGTYNGNPYRVTFPDELLSKHCMVLGGTGSGKTNFINHLISRIKPQLHHNDVIIIFDTKGDYFNEFYCSSDIVLSNCPEHLQITQKWNVYREVVADGWDDNNVVLNANEIAWGIFQDVIEKSSNQPFFPKAARDLFAAILIHFIRMGGDDRAFKMKYYNNKALKRYFDIATPDKINAILKNEVDLSAVKFYLGEKETNQGLGVFAELQQAIRSIFVGTFSDNGAFSIRDFVRNKGGKTLFIEYDLTMGNTLTPIYRLLIDLALKEAMGRSKGQGSVYIICDEFKLLPHLQHIEDAVNFGRSLGVKVIAGLQSIAQLYELYGENRGRSIASGFSNIVTFHVNDVISRDYIRDLYGKNLLLEQYSMSDSSLVEEQREGHTVEDWDIQELQTGDAIIGLHQMKPFRFHVDLFK